MIISIIKVIFSLLIILSLLVGFIILFISENSDMGNEKLLEKNWKEEMNKKR